LTREPVWRCNIMAGKRKPRPPLSSADRAELLDVIRNSSGPVTAAQLYKLLPVPRKVVTAEVAPVLEEYVAGGALQRIPPATAKGKPRYWDRDVRAIARSAALDALQRGDGPLTAVDLAKRLDIPLKFTARDLIPVLDECVAAGSLHAIPAKTAKGKPRYWNRDALAFGRLTILGVVTAKGPQTQANLRKSVKWLSDTQFAQVFHDLRDSRDLLPQPPVSGSGGEKFGNRPPSPGPYLKKLGTELSKVVEKLTAAGVARDDLRRALVELIEAAGIPFGSTGSAPSASVPAPRGDAVDLISLMKRLEPGAERGALVGARDLRRAARLDKAHFDSAVLELSRRGRVSLHRHDYPASLTPEERDELVTDGAGTYYVGLALRQSGGAL
jgi:hypothetical protein